MMKILFFLLILSCFSYGQIPCGSNFTADLIMASSASLVTPCNNMMPIIMVPQSRLCGQVVSTGQILNYAVIIEDNTLLVDLQFGITVFTNNATSLDDDNFIKVYIAKGNCPSPVCPSASNPFSITCGYDFLLQGSQISSVSAPLVTYYRNTADAVYYIQVWGPPAGEAAFTSISFDIQIDNGPQTLAKYVSVIAVILFCVVFAAVIIVIFVWKKTHGGWRKEEIVIKKDKSMSRVDLLQRVDSVGNMSVQSDSVSLEQVVTLFREQTATINRMTEAVVNTIEEKKEEKREEKKEEKKEENIVEEKNLKHREGIAKKDSFVLKNDKDSSDSSDESE